MKPVLISALPIVLLLSSCGKQAEQKKVQAAAAPDPVAIRIALAESRTVERTVPVTGALFPDETVTVSAEVPGRVLAVHFDFGQSVRKGQVIAELDRQELQLSLDRAKASLAQALARIGLDPKQEEATPDSTAAMRQAQAQLEDAKFKYENAQRLVKTGDISKERFTELEKTYTTRIAAFESTRDDLRMQLATIQALRTDVRLAQKRFNDATVYAPFDGSVTQKQVSPGQYIKDNTPIVTLVKTNPMRLRLEVPESATANLRIGTALTFVTDAAPGAEFHAVVRELNPALDSRSRSLTAEARLQEADPRLRPGMFVQVRLITEKQAQIVAVPKQAVYTIAGLSKVFTVSGDKVVEHRINPGTDLGAFVEVPGSEIKPGDQVAISRTAQLVNGAAVKVEASPKG
jgi:RND family efflux transporter MFP subunit